MDNIHIIYNIFNINNVNILSAVEPMNILLTRIEFLEAVYWLSSIFQAVYLGCVLKYNIHL